MPVLASSTSSTPPPFGPAVGLVLALACLAAALLCIRGMARTYDERQHARGRTGPTPHWWQMRLTGFNGAPMAAAVVCFLCWSVSMACYALFVGTGADLAGAASVVVGLGGTAYFVLAYVHATFSGKYDA